MLFKNWMEIFRRFQRLFYVINLPTYLSGCIRLNREFWLELKSYLTQVNRDIRELIDKQKLKHIGSRILLLFCESAPYNNPTAHN